MATHKETAEALRAIADLIEWAGPEGERYDIRQLLVGVVRLPATWASLGHVARILPAMTDVTTEPYDTESTHYVIYRGQMLGQTWEVMESQDD